MSRLADRDFQAFLDADDSIEENDGGNSPTVFKDSTCDAKKDSQRFGRPLSAMSASTAADEGGAGMMVGGIQVRMPGQSRPNSASSSRLGSRPTTAQKDPDSGWQEGRSNSPMPESPPSKTLGLGPVESLRGRSQSPAPGFGIGRFVALSPSTPSRHEAADSFGSRSFDRASDPLSPVAAHGRSLAPMSGRLGALSPAGPEACGVWG
eukprot:s7951_g1.t1